MKNKLPELDPRQPGIFRLIIETAAQVRQQRAVARLEVQIKRKIDLKKKTRDYDAYVLRQEENGMSMYRKNLEGRKFSNSR